MNREEQVEFSEQIQEYLQKNNIHHIFGQLLQQIITHKPKNIVDFAIQHLSQPEKCLFFVVGPPSISLNALLPKALANHSTSFEILNVGKEISSLEMDLKEDEKQNLKGARLLSNQAISSVIDKIEKAAKSDKSYVIEGFPKNLSQALELQRRGVQVSNILIINVHNEGLMNLCTSKVDEASPQADMFTKSDLVRQAVLEHEINNKQLKKFYRHYQQIDISRSKQESFIIRELQKALDTHLIQSAPRAVSQIIIVGAPFSGRTTLGKKIAQHYNLIYISTSQLIAEQVRRDTIHGRKVKSDFLDNNLVDNFLIEKLIEERIFKKDCRMQGFVLEGYPKTKQQLENIKNMKLDPTMIISIDTPKEVCEQRSAIDPIKLGSRYENWKKLQACLKESKEKIFWVDPLLGLHNMYQEAIHELEKTIA